MITLSVRLPTTFFVLALLACAFCCRGWAGDRPPAAASSRSASPTRRPTSTLLYGPGGYANPTLSNPVNPLSYGADNTGVNSSSDAFQNAVSAGDVLIPAGTYKITTQIRVPNNRNVRCADPATVTISFPQSTNGYAFLWAGTGPGSIANCTFTGTNTAHPAGYVAANQWNHFVEIEYGAHDIWVGNNYFRNCWGNACVHTYTNDNKPATNNIIIRNNQFENCGIYGPTTDATTNQYIVYNIAVDCTIGPESDDSLQPKNTGLIEQNQIIRKFGTGWENIGGIALSFTCGWANGLDYSGMICANNQGAFSAPATHLPWLYGTMVVGHGTYVNNHGFVVKN